jgi:hypothetical protein
MAFPVINPFFQFFDDAGLEPLAGGFVETYESSSSTPKVTYQDADLSSPNENPIDLDAAGRCSIFVGDGETFKYILKNSAGVVVDTKDKVQSPISSAAGLAALLNPPTTAEIAENVTPPSLSYQDGVSLRYLPSAQITLIQSGDAASQTASTVLSGLQDAHDVYHGIIYPRGNYKVDGTILLRPWSDVRGAGKAEYVSSLTDATTGTRIIATTNNFIFSTDIGPDEDASYAGNISIRDMTILGGTVASPIGNYGVHATSSNQMLLENVKASFFTLSGFRFSGSLLPTLRDCDASYCQNAGIALDYGPLGTAQDSNSYMGRITGGSIHQCKNYGIYLGTSSVKVRIEGVDIESTGTFYSSGTGYGIYLDGEARLTTINDCWLEGNKVHIVVGTDADATLVTVPKNTRIANCLFGTTSGGGPNIILNSGRDTVIENNEFGGSTILIKSKADNPIIRNNTGDPEIEDANTNTVTLDNKDMTNNFVYPDISTWTLTNCTVAQEFVASPAGPIPVYKVTPSATGVVALQATNAVYSYLERRQTIGCYLKTDGTAERDLLIVVASTNMSKSYTAVETDTRPVHTFWKWVSIGRGKDIADTGNQAFGLQVTVTTTDAFYVTGFSSRDGICYDPYKVPDGVIGAMTNAATPSVYGMRYARTGGTTTITDLTGGGLGQTVTIIAEHSLTITDGTNLFLAGSTNFAMNATDTLTVVMKADGNWYEIGRSDNT